MLAFIFSLICRHSCKKHLAAMRKYRGPSHRWTWQPSHSNGSCA